MSLLLETSQNFMNKQVKSSLQYTNPACSILTVKVLKLMWSDTHFVFWDARSNLQDKDMKLLDDSAVLRLPVDHARIVNHSYNNASC